MAVAPNILICDDDPVVHESLGLYLDNDNFTHSDAYDGRESLEMAQATKPDLILLDGGSGQVNAVKPVLDKYNLDIPLFGMVKDSHHRTRAIACSGDELSLTSKRAAFTLVSTIQEEVHRYSVEYHRNRRKKSTLSSTLTSIDGIGESRCKALLKHFKTVKAVSTATEDELAAVKGMNKNAAKAVFEAFHGKNTPKED